ncbi:hypothetical protein Daus18300_011417 [Diaporthe australafricana]|uniref:Zn(2)-C6 fungal-type domain-containing protein n=1 Tax=Diaporthe australafricana TaxID=127596 RepID=A0ABR3W715_9PEZI
MSASRYSISRQKACQHCSAAKAKCDRQQDCCGRCALRGLECRYPDRHSRTPAASPNSGRLNLDDSTIVSTDPIRLPAFVQMPLNLSTNPAMRTPATPRRSTTPAFTPSGDGTRPTVTSSTTSAGSTPASASASATAYSHGQNPSPNATEPLADAEFCCPINADHISSRWLNPYVPIPGQEVKKYPANIKAFIPRILASYASVAVRGKGIPPFIHPAQLQPSLARPPLSTCLSLVRVCERLLPGSDGAAADVLQREMSGLFAQHASMADDAATLLSAFQAHLLYAMVLFFRLGHRDAGRSLRQAMMDLQSLASLCCGRGLVCVAEQEGARPRWEAWIVAEAKRRTLYVMYLFDSVLSTHEGMPTFFGTELRGLPAPAAKHLWEAQTRRDWETAYNNHLADWAEGGLRIDELWPAPPWLDGPGVVERRDRVDRWLDEIDGFGTMLYAVSSSSHNS